MKNSTKRNALLSVVAASALVLAGCSAAGGDGGDDVIRIGVVGPQSGPLAEIGENQVAGARIAAAHINEDGGIDGRMIEIVDQDEQGTPETAATAIRNLSNDGVQLVVGMLSSAACLAVAPTLPSMNMVLVDTGCTNDGLTGQDGEPAPFPNLFRTSNNDSRLIGPLAQTIAEQFPDVTEYSAFGYDYVTGTSQWALFQEEIAEQGVDISVASETFVPIGEQNFGLQIQSLVNRVDDPSTSALYLGTFSSGTGSFLTQAEAYDLASQFEVIVNPGGYYPVARTLGGSAPEVWNAYDYHYGAFDNEANARFVEDFQAETGMMPVDWSYDAYVGVLAMAAAIEQAGSSDYQAVLDALPGLTFETPGGELTIDATTHQTNNPVVVTHTVGNPDADEDIELLDSFVVTAGD